jgi:hypothetical protein
MLQALLARAIFLLLAPIDPVVRWLTILRPTRRVSGFSLFARSHDLGADDLVSKLEEALSLLERYDPRRFRRVRADVRRIIASDSGHAGTHWRWPRAVVLNATLVKDHPALWAAAGIVHEATHVRLRGAGIRTTDANRSRVEGRCMVEEIAFLRRVGADPHHAAHAQHYIEGVERALSAPRPWYEPGERWHRIRELLVAESVPGWLLWLFDGLRPTRAESSGQDGA